MNATYLKSNAAGATIVMEEITDEPFGPVVAFEITRAEPFVTFSLALVEAVHVNGRPADGEFWQWNERPFYGRSWLEGTRPLSEDRRPHRDVYLGAFLHIEARNRHLVYRLGQVYEDDRFAARFVINGHWPD